MHRKIYTLIAVMAFVILTVCCAFGEVAIDEEHFPDSAFRAYVVTYFDINRDGVLSNSEIEGAETIILSNCFIGSGIMRVKSLKGIEYLTALKRLDCSLNGLTYLDVSKNKALTDLDCSGNMLEKLNVSGCTALTRLDCSSNLLRELDVSSCKSLTSLGCSYNYIEKLDLRQNGIVLNKNGIDTFREFYSKEYMDVVRDTYEVDIHYTIGGFRDGNVRVYRGSTCF